MPQDIEPQAFGSIGPVEFAERLALARLRCAEARLSALLITPGTDLRYLTGYQAIPMERLTCLVLSASDEPFLVVPALETAAALASPVADLDLEVVPWQETADPYSMIANRLGEVSAVGFDNQMLAEKAFAFLEALPITGRSLANEVLSPMRMVKSAAEIESLSAAGRAIDAVHSQVAGFLRAGRTEAEVGADIAAAILEAGHQSVDFVIVGSGPNGASPHHELSSRRISAGEPIVVDIGGTMPDGYCSDSTRMYSIGEPPAEFVDYYGILQAAQWQAVRTVRPGTTAEEIDAAARDIITSSGFGDQFIHRTGHGIGLDTHEDPYIVSGNKQKIQEGNAFSIEPGIYLAGSHGARIEDIVVCAEDGALVLNQRPRGLEIVEP